jgi:hypothetical protein
MGRRDGSVVALLQLVEALLQGVELEDELGDGEEDPVEEQRGGDEERVALRLDDGLVVAEVLGGRAGVLVAAGGARLVLPVDVHEQEEAERHHRHHGLQRAPHDGDHASAEAGEARDRQQQQHDGLRARRVPEHHPLQRHRRGPCWISIWGVGRFESRRGGEARDWGSIGCDGFGGFFFFLPSARGAGRGGRRIGGLVRATGLWSESFAGPDGLVEALVNAA